MSFTTRGSQSHSTGALQQRIGRDMNSYIMFLEQQNDNIETHSRQFFGNMKNERHRLESFLRGNWPLSFINPNDLAKAGFYYLKVGDEVRCAFCSGELDNWKQGDIPLIEHIRHYPRCKFILEFNVGNVPIDVDPIRGRAENN
ncbi:baculoviral IAP repeat-containing protein 2-like protein, partial [Leptotrombidium deliense]